MVRVAMEFFEKWLPLLARNDAQLRALTEAVLRYGREIGFAAASIYASAAESRGAWDSRLEALVVDAVVRGDTGPTLLSRAAALNWDAEVTATVLVGMPPPERNVSVPLAVHNTARQHDRAALSVVQGSLLVAIVSGPVSLDEPFIIDLLNLSPMARSSSDRRRRISAWRTRARSTPWPGSRRSPGGRALRGLSIPGNCCPSAPCSAIKLR